LPGEVPEESFAIVEIYLARVSDPPSFVKRTGPSQRIALITKRIYLKASEFQNFKAVILNMLGKTKISGEIEEKEVSKILEREYRYL